MGGRDRRNTPRTSRLPCLSCLVFTKAVGREQLCPSLHGKGHRSMALSAPAKAAGSALSKMAPHHQPAPSTGNADRCLEQPADGCSRASMVWLLALPFPSTKGRSSIYCCGQRWWLPRRAWSPSHVTATLGERFLIMPSSSCALLSFS